MIKKSESITTGIVSENPQTVECRRIGLVRGATSPLTGLFPRSQSDIYDKVLYYSVQVGQYAVTESNALPGKYEAGVVIEKVQNSCPEQAERCAGCILNVLSSEIDHVDPQEIVTRLSRSINPKVVTN